MMRNRRQAAFYMIIHATFLKFNSYPKNMRYINFFFTLYTIHLKKLIFEIDSNPKGAISCSK